MKHFVKIILLSVILLAGSMPAEARTSGRDKSPKKSADRTELARRQAQRIADQLALDDATASRFIDTYMQCEQEKWALEKTPRNPYARLTEAQTDSMLRANLDHSRRLLDLREKYYREYRKFLTAKQVARIYQAERMQNINIRGKHQADRTKQREARARQAPRRPVK